MIEFKFSTFIKHVIIAIGIFFIIDYVVVSCVGHNINIQNQIMKQVLEESKTVNR